MPSFRKPGDTRKHFSGKAGIDPATKRTLGATENQDRDCTAEEASLQIIVDSGASDYYVDGDLFQDFRSKLSNYY